MTLPQEALADPDTAQARPAQQTATGSSLICPADLIYDATEVNAAIDESLAGLSDRREIRANVVVQLRAALDNGRSVIDAAYLAQPYAARQTVRSYAYLTDCITNAALRVATTWLQ